MFFFFNCIAWPLGFLETVIQYIHMDKYKIAFFENYVTSESCQSNFTFVLRENGTKCLLGEYGAPFLASYYIFAFVVIVATNVVFVGVFIRAYINWRKTERQVEARAEQLSRAVGFIVAASSHRNLLISSIQECSVDNCSIFSSLQTVGFSSFNNNSNHFFICFHSF